MGRGTLFADAGPRFLWADPLDASTLIQRAVIHPCLGLASGRGAKIINWEHENFGLPLAVLLGKKAKNPASWGTVKLGQEAAEHLDWLPALPKDDWVRYQWFEDGTRIVGLSRGKTGTRGTVPLSLSKGSEVTYFTAAKSKGQGNWSQCGSKLVGKKWVVESGDGKLEVKVPGEPTLEVLWDSEGARVVIGGTQPTKPAPTKRGTAKPGATTPRPPRPPEKIERAREWAQTLDGLVEKVSTSVAEGRTALGQIKNRGKQIVKLLPGNVDKTREWAQTLEGLADKVKTSGAEGKTALNQIKNRGKQIVNLLT